MSGCICEGNWRAIVAEYEPLIGARFRSTHNGKEYTFFGLVHGADDYYYGMRERGTGVLTMLSCVGHLIGDNGWGLELIEDTERASLSNPLAY